jgi:hypothetical protein
MRRSAICAVAVVASLGACEGDSQPERATGPAPAPASASAPQPGAQIPRDPDALADRLGSAERELAAAIDSWREEGDLGAHPPPREVTLWALHQQRIHLLLTARPGLARQALPLLPREVAAHARATIRARRGLGEITPPTPGSYRTGPPEPPRRLLAHYREAQRRFGIPWSTLAAVNFVESAFGRMRNSSAAGAQGPMQFIPSTWRAYGMGGDVNDPRDAIMGAANYLRASGAPGDLRGALYAYNPSDLYVRAVLAYSGRIRRDRHAFLSYYSWQVFVREPGGGTRRITGPRPF